MTSTADEKYKSELAFHATRARRWLVRRAIRDLVTWEPLRQPREGYTVVIGCNVPLARMLSCNLTFLARQELSHADRILVVLDRPRSALPDDIEPDMRSRFGGLPLEFLYYDESQFRTVQRIGWPWVASWLSWSLGVAAAKTKYVLLHDFDAMLLRPDVLEERFQTIRSRGHNWVGVRFYNGGGVVPDDGLVTTFELILDAESVRRELAPIDAFNHVVRHGGRRLDLDTFLYAQTRVRGASVAPVSEEDMVHPSQMICQFEDFRIARGREVPRRNNLLLVPYFLFVGGEPSMMEEISRAMQLGPGCSVPYFGRTLDFSGLDDAHVRWIAKQAARLERSAVGGVRAEVKEYFTRIDLNLARLHGREPALGSETW
jgi:hypothetical protein